MSEHLHHSDALLPTGVPGLDAVLGGGLPEYSFNLITGTPGAGKTTLVHQIMFRNATTTHPVLYFTVMGEPPIKILRHQRHFRFFNPAQLGAGIRFIDLSDIVLVEGLQAVLERIVGEVEKTRPAFVIVDSFQAIVRVATNSENGQLDLQSFVQRLALHLTSWQATTFLVGEFLEDTFHNNPLLTVADGIIRLTQDTYRSSVVRRLQVVKQRGVAPMPGVHTVRISQDGFEVYPRMSLSADDRDRVRPDGRARTGVAGLDALIGGGIPKGDAVLISGPSGTGKSVLATQFIAAGVDQDEPGVIAVFEEHPKEYMRRASQLGFDLEAMERRGTLKMIYIRPLDLSPDETLQAIQNAVQEIGARRVVIDSVSGFELALAPTYREDFRESLYRLVGALTGTGITVLMTMEIEQNTTDLRFSAYIVSFLADDIILLRYVEIDGQIQKSIVVVKMRNSAHSKSMHLHEITGQGLVVRQSLHEYGSIGSGMPERREDAPTPGFPGLIEQEAIVLRALVELGEAPTEAIAGRVGRQNDAELAGALDRLVRLQYAVVIGDGDAIHYRALAQTGRS